MADAQTTELPAPPRNGQPKTPRDAAAMARYDRIARVPIILSAVLPLILVPQQGHWVAIVVGVASWLVFVVDFVVHRRLLTHYLATRLGMFDLAIVVVTAPWFLVPGFQGGGFVVVLRLARLLRLVVASRGAKRLFERLGSVALVASGVVLVGAAVAYYAEHPVNPEYKTYKDSLWWAIVTLTTVGYGDIVPVTSTGRVVAVLIMLTGVSVLGLLAGSLASFFRLAPSTSESSEAGAEPAADEEPATVADLTREVAAMRAQLALLTERLTPSGDPSS